MTQAKQQWTLYVSSNLVVTGYEAEMADWDNPQGAQVSEVFHLAATTVRGDRKAWGGFSTEAEAWAAIPAAPAVFWWADDAPVYGSEAYQAEGTEADTLAWERANDGPIYGLRGMPTQGHYQGVM